MYAKTAPKEVLGACGPLGVSRKRNPRSGRAYAYTRMRVID